MVELIALGFIVILILAAWRKLHKQLDSLSSKIERVNDRIDTVESLWNILNTKFHTELLGISYNTKITSKNLEHLVKTIQAINFQDHRTTFNTLLRTPNKPKYLEEYLIMGITDGTFEIDGIPCKYFLTYEERNKALKYLEEFLD